MGSMYLTVIVRSRIDLPCRLDTRPTLLYRAGGSTALRPVPAGKLAGDQAPMLLLARGQAAFVIRTRNGCAPPADPSVCPNAVRYDRLWVELAGGQAYLLDGLTLDAPQDGPDVGTWQTWPQ